MPRRSAAAGMAAEGMRVRKAIVEEAGTRSSVRAVTRNSARMATAEARIISATMPAARTFNVASIAMLAGMNGRLTVKIGMFVRNGMFAVMSAMSNASASATSATRIKKRSIATGMRMTAKPIAANASISRTIGAAVRGRDRKSVV